MTMDRYLERFRDRMDDEYQLDVTYRAHVICSAVMTNLCLACAAVLAWVLPPNYVLVSEIMCVPVFAGSIVVALYMQKRVVRPRISIWGYSRLELVLTIIWGTAWMAGLMRFPAYSESPTATRATIIASIVGFIMIMAILKWANERARAWDRKRLEDVE